MGKTEVPMAVLLHKPPIPRPMGKMKFMMSKGAVNKQENTSIYFIGDKITQIIYQYVPVVKLESLSNRRLYLGDIKDAVKKEIEDIFKDKTIVAVKMNEITLNRLRATYSYEVAIVPKTKIYLEAEEKILGQICGRPIIGIKEGYVTATGGKILPIETFVIVPVRINPYRAKEQRKMSFIHDKLGGK